MSKPRLFSQWDRCSQWQTWVVKYVYIEEDDIELPLVLCRTPCGPPLVHLLHTSIASDRPRHMRPAEPPPPPPQLRPLLCLKSPGLGVVVSQRVLWLAVAMRGRCSAFDRHRVRWSVAGHGRRMSRVCVWVRHSVGLLFLYGALDSCPFFPLHAASGHCVLLAAAACVPAGVVSAFAEPSSWCTGGCTGRCRGRFTVLAAHSPPHSGRPPHASPRFRVREAQVLHPSAYCPGRPPSASPRCCVCAPPPPPCPLRPRMACPQVTNSNAQMTEVRRVEGGRMRPLQNWLFARSAPLSPTNVLMNWHQLVASGPVCRAQRVLPATWA